MDRESEISAIQRNIDYNSGYVDGYKEGYYKALSEFQHIIDIQTRPIVITVEANNINVDDILETLKHSSKQASY